jgi:hypothetical protein
MTGKRFTKWLCYAHGIITGSGFVALLVFAGEKYFLRQKETE